MGLVNRVVGDGEALASAIALALEIAAVPQDCMRNDRASVLDAHALDLDAAMARELAHGERSLQSPGLAEGVGRFVAGAGRHGARG
jgi:enoyl-CoA hydratase